MNGSTCGEAFRTRTAVRVDELVSNPLEGIAVSRGPALVLPLHCDRSVLGVLVCSRELGSPPFDEQLMPVATSFADQAALGLRLARDHQRQHELDVLADRDRIARDLHDHVIQRLFALGLSLQGVTPRVKVPEVRDRIAETIDDLQDVMSKIRGAIFDLQRENADNTRLRERLLHVLVEATESTDIRTSVRMSGPLRVVDPGLADHAEAVVREAIGNAVRHAHASTVTLTVSVDDDLTIDVTDDGIGIPAQVARSGLRKLAQRAEEADGALHVVKSTAGGTRLVWSVPLP